MVQTVKIQGHMLQRAGDVASINADKRTVDLVFATGYKGKRTDFWSGDSWFEDLPVETMRLDSLNSGAPLLDLHRQWDLTNVLGVVERAWVQDGKGMATVRFSSRAEVDPVFQDVKDGIIRNISVGYRVDKWEETTASDDKIPTYRATDWTPREVSLVPIGFDPGAQTRGSERGKGREAETFEMEFILTRSAKGETTQRGQSIMEPKPENKEGQGAGAAGSTVDEKQIRAQAAAEAVEKERKRIADITRNCARHGIDNATRDGFIKEGVSVKVANERILDKLAERGDKTATITATGSVQAGEQDEIKTRHDAASNAMLHRSFPDRVELTEAGREFRGMTLMEMGREFLTRSGVSTKGMGRNEIAVACLRTRSGGFNAVGDFPNVLANVLNKSLLQGYEKLFQMQTFRPFVTVKTAPDFKQVKRVRLGEVPSLEAVPEGAEVKRGTIGDTGEVYNLATYAKIFGVTREVIINDDLSAFTDIPAKFGAGAARLESDIVYAVLTANANMGDGNALFSSTHGNLAGSGAVIAVGTIGTGRAAMRTQKGIAKKDYLNIAPKFLLVPAAIETTADQFVTTALLANQATSVNPFAGKLQTIAEPRLDANSTTAWYLMADPAQGVDMIELLYLDGATGLQVVTDVGFDRNGVEVKALLDVAAKALDWKGMYKNPGA